jgi:hypothetical protein
LSEQLTELPTTIHDDGFDERTTANLSLPGLIDHINFEKQLLQEAHSYLMKRKRNIRDQQHEIQAQQERWRSRKRMLEGSESASAEERSANLAQLRQQKVDLDGRSHVLNEGMPWLLNHVQLYTLMIFIWIAKRYSHFIFLNVLPCQRFANLNPCNHCWNARSKKLMNLKHT